MKCLLPAPAKNRETTAKGMVPVRIADGERIVMESIMDVKR